MARWRLRHRTASRSVLPSACLRLRLGLGSGIEPELDEGDGMEGPVQLAVTVAAEAVTLDVSG